MACGAPCDALLVKANYDGDAERIWRLDRELHAARAAREARDGQRKIGKRLLQLGRALYPDLSWHALDVAIERGHVVGAFPTIYGWICRQLEVPRETRGRGISVSLRQRLREITRQGRCDWAQTQSQQIIGVLLPQIELAWAQVADKSPDSWASNGLRLEVAQMRHETIVFALIYVVKCSHRKTPGKA